jgi:DNA-binding NtrC family response regulator
MNDSASALSMPGVGMLPSRLSGRERNQQRHADWPQRPSAASPVMKILIVDDQPSIARVTEVALGLLGCRTFTSRTTADAARLLATEKVEAIFLDLNLKGESGLEFLSQLTALDSRTPVIIFTAKFRDEFAEEARRRGAFSYLAKPFNLDDLRRQLTQIELYHGQRADALISHESQDNE